MPTTPVPIDPPGLPLPDPNDKLTFSPRKLEEGRWMREDVVPGIEALADATYDNAVEANAAAASATTNGATQVALATAQANAAAASAQSALNAPGTNGTTATSLTVGLGSKTFTTQTGKAWVPGQRLLLPRTSDPAGTWMSGTLTAYNSGTGAATLLVTNFAGSGTFTDWTVALGVVPPGGVLPTNPITSGGAYAAAVNVDNLLDANGIAMTAPTSKAVGDIFQCQVVNSRTGCSADFGADKVWGRTAGVMDLDSENARFKFKWSGSTYGWVNA